MRFRLVALCFACLPLATLADSVHTIEVVNGTHARIDSFALAPAGTTDWTEVEFRKPMQAFYFDDDLAVTLEVHDHDGCLRDLRTVLSNGRRILAHNFDLCHFHSYWPGRRFPKGHPGSQIMP